MSKLLLSETMWCIAVPQWALVNLLQSAVSEHRDGNFSTILFAFWWNSFGLCQHWCLEAYFKMSCCHLPIQCHFSVRTHCRDCAPIWNRPPHVPRQCSTFSHSFFWYMAQCVLSINYLKGLHIKKQPMDCFANRWTMTFKPLKFCPS